MKHLSSSLFIVTLAIGFSPLVAFGNPRGVNALSPQQGSTLKLNSYFDQNAGISFGYPENWRIRQDKDTNETFKASANPAESLNAELTLSRFEDLAYSERQAAAFVESEILNKIPGVKKLGEQDILFGHQQFKAVSQVFEIPINGVKFWQRRVYFLSSDKKTLVFAFLCPESQSGQLLPVTNHILSSVSLINQANAPPSNEAAKPISSITFDTYTGSNGSVSLEYPAKWKVQNVYDGNTLVKISGTEFGGKQGEIAVHTSEANYSSSEELAQALENEIFKKNPDIKNFRRERDESKSFGPNAMPGFVAEYSCDYSGQPVRQLIAFIRAQNRHYVLDLRGVNWTQNDLRWVFSRIASSLKISE
jgi:hypothetical protein